MSEIVAANFTQLVIAFGVVLVVFLVINLIVVRNKKKQRELRDQLLREYADRRLDAARELAWGLGIRINKPIGTEFRKINPDIWTSFSITPLARFFSSLLHDEGYVDDYTFELVAEGLDDYLSPDEIDSFVKATGSRHSSMGSGADIRKKLEMALDQVRNKRAQEQQSRDKEATLAAKEARIKQGLKACKHLLPEGPLPKF